MEILAIRHAPTASNVNGTFMGLIDAPCLAGSTKHAHGRAEYPDDIICYCSPLIRARETAEALFSGDRIKLDERLVERDLGEWSGMLKSDVASKYPQAFNEGGLLDFFFTPPNGEHYETLVRRVADFLVDAGRQHESEKIAVVTHNGVLRVMRSLIEGMPMGDVFKKSEEHLLPYRYELTLDRVYEIEANPLLTLSV